MGTNTQRDTSGILSSERTEVEYSGCKSYHFKINLPDDDKYIHDAVEASKGSYTDKYINKSEYKGEINSSLLFTMGDDTPVY